MQPISTTRWGIVFAIWAAGLGAAAQFGKISVTFEELGVMYPQAGGSLSWSLGLVGLVGLFFGVVAGLYVSSFGFRRTLVWSLWIGAAMSTLQALTLPYGLFLLTRVIEGISHLGIVVAAPTLIPAVSEKRHLGLALTIWSTFFGVAFALLGWVGLPLVASHGVTALFAAHAAVMMLLALALPLALRNMSAPPRMEMPQLRDLLRLHMSLYRAPRKLAPAIGWVCYTGCFVVLLTVLPGLVAEEQRVFVTGAMPLVSIMAAMTFGVLLLRWMPAVRLVQMGFIGGIFLLVWMLAYGVSVPVILVLVGVLGILQGASFATVPELNDSSIDQGHANGVMTQGGNAGNVLTTVFILYAFQIGGFAGMVISICLLFAIGAGGHELLRRRMGKQGA